MAKEAFADMKKVLCNNKRKVEKKNKMGGWKVCGLFKCMVVNMDSD